MCAAILRNRVFWHHGFFVLSVFRALLFSQKIKAPMNSEFDEAPLWSDAAKQKIITCDIREALRRGALDQLMLQTFMDSLQDCGVYFKDRQSRFLKVNAYIVQKLGGKNPDDFVGKTDADFFTEEHAMQARADEQSIMETGQALIDVEEKETFPDGHVAWASTSKMPLRDPLKNIIGTFGISRDITVRKETEIKLAATQKELVEASRLAGMAEISSGVLHNIGNALNSVTTSSSLLSEQQARSRLPNLGKVVQMIEQHLGDLPVFLGQDDKGKQIPGYLIQLSQSLLLEREQMQKELETLRHNIEHIKELIAMQQNFARSSHLIEEVAPSELFEESIRISEASLNRHGITVIKRFETVPLIQVPRHKVLQVLVNYIRNAKHAMDDSGRNDKIMTLGLGMTADGLIKFVVEDNGVGVPPENLSKLFTFGFTTRQHGHGFGLHSSVTAARDLGGRVRCESRGKDMGASFFLEIPASLPSEDKGIPHK